MHARTLSRSHAHLHDFSTDAPKHARMHARTRTSIPKEKCAHVPSEIKREEETVAFFEQFLNTTDRRTPFSEYLLGVFRLLAPAYTASLIPCSLGCVSQGAEIVADDVCAAIDEVLKRHPPTHAS